jgi:predicted nucleotidyltransferase
MISRDFLAKVKAALAEEFGERFRGLVLFGSEARGEAEPDSDVDLLVLLRGPVDLTADLRRIIAATYDMELEIDRPLSAIPMDEEAYQQGELPFLWEVRKEAVVL